MANENVDGTIVWGFDYAPVVSGMNAMDSFVTSKAEAIGSKLDSLSKKALGGTSLGTNVTAINGHFDSLTGKSQALLTHLDRMSNMFTGGLGIGVAVGGLAILERSFDKAISKAREFQTAQISIAATLSSSGYRTAPNGSRLNSQDAFQANMKYAQELQAQLLRASAKNHLTFQEQLGAFQSSVATGTNKGLSTKQIFDLSDLGAMAAKSLGLRGEQIANATRLLMGGGVNVARSTIGRALGISNTDITARSGDSLYKFLKIKLEGFSAAQGEFGDSIEGIVSTLQSKLDTALAKVGMNFFKSVKPTLMQIIDATESPQMRKGESKAEYDKRYNTFLTGQLAQAKLTDSLSKGFEGIFNALVKITSSGAFEQFVNFLTFLAQHTDTIVLGAVFLSIAGAIGKAQSAAASFADTLRKLAGVEAMAGVGGGGGGVAGGRGANLRNATSGARGATAEGSVLEQMMAARGMTIADQRREFQDMLLQEFVPLPNSPGSKARNATRFGEYMLRRANAASGLEELGMMGPPGRMGAGEAFGRLGGMPRFTGGSFRGQLAALGEGAANRIPGAALLAMGGMGLGDMLGADTAGGKFAQGAGLGAGAGFMIGGPVGAVIVGLVAGLASAGPALLGVSEAADKAAKAMISLEDTTTRTPQGTRVSDANANYRRRLEAAEEGGMTGNRLRQYIGYLQKQRDAVRGSAQQGSVYHGYFDEAKAEADLLTARSKELKEFSGNLKDQNTVAVNELKIKSATARSEFWQFKEKGQTTGQAEQEANRITMASPAYRAAKAAGDTAKMQALLTAGQGAYERNLLNRREAVVSQGLAGTQAAFALRESAAGMLGPTQGKGKELAEKMASTIDTVTKDIGDIRFGAGRQAIQAALDTLGVNVAKDVRDIHQKQLEQVANTQKRQLEQSEFYFKRPFQRELLQLQQNEEFPQQQQELQFRKVQLEFEKRQMEMDKENLALRGQQMDVQAGIRAQHRQELALSASQTALRETERLTRFQWTREDRPIEQAKANIGASNAGNAETLFYGGLGPMGKIASAIRYKVESQYASRFNPQEYEKAYGQQVENQIASMRLDAMAAQRKASRLDQEFKMQDQEAAAAAQEYQLALQRIASEKLEADLADQQAAIEKKRLALEQAELAQRPQELALKKAELGTDQKKLNLTQGEAAKNLQFFDLETIATISSFKALNAAAKNAAIDLTRASAEISGEVSVYDKLRGVTKSTGAPVYKLPKKQHGGISGTHTAAGRASDTEETTGITINVPLTVHGSEHFADGLHKHVKKAVKEYCDEQARKPH